MYKSGSGFSGSATILCRQPKNMIIHNRSFDGLYRGRKDARWQKLITSFDADKSEFVSAKICDVVQLGAADQLYKMTLRNKKEVTCVLEQKFYTREGYKPLSELKEGDCIGSMRSKLAWFSVIDSIEPVAAEGKQVYTLTLEEPADSVIVNGIIAKID